MHTSNVAHHHNLDAVLMIFSKGTQTEKMFNKTNKRCPEFEFVVRTVDEYLDAKTESIQVRVFKNKMLICIDLISISIFQNLDR